MNPIRALLVASLRLEFFRQVLEGITRGLDSAASLHCTEHSEGILRAIREHGIQGVLLGVSNPRVHRTLLRRDIPCVNVSNLFPSPHPSVLNDDEAVGRLAAEFFLDNGYRRFTYVGHSLHRYSQERQKGFEERLRLQGCSCRVFLDVQHRPEPLREGLTSLTPPVALFACTDYLAARVYRQIRQMGWLVPEEVAILGVDNDPLASALAGLPLSSVVLNGLEVGRRAAELLLNLIRGKKPPPQPVRVPPLRVENRRSTDALAFEDTRVSAALAYLRAHYREPLHVSEVARHAALSLRLLEMRFRRLVGRTVKKEMLRLRLDYARRLLCETSLPISAIAEEAGFGDVYQFSRAFRRSTGTSPTLFRARLH